MRNPLWIINLTLAIILALVFIYIFFSLFYLTETKIIPLKPLPKIEQPRIEKLKPKDIKFIYEDNDLFGTYTPAKTAVAPVVKIPKLPPRPAPKPLTVQPPPEVQFLEPLPIKITGIIAHSTESKSQVTIVNTKTKETESHKVGDKIFDAYIIRILPKKIILIRSNGQQETLYLYPEDAEEDIKKLKETSWKDVVYQKDPTTFVINAQAFALRITSLAQLIEMLDATTAFSKGESIGCRIGKMQDKSIGYSLGLLPGDIIVDIAGIKPTTTTNRVSIYNKIFSLKSGDSAKIKLLRNNQEIIHTYLITGKNETNQNKDKIEPLIKEKTETKESSKNKIQNKIQRSAKKIAMNIRKMDQRQLPKKYQTEMRKKDRYAMENFGSRNSVLKGLAT